jgi:hypothetical protein
VAPISIKIMIIITVIIITRAIFCFGHIFYLLIYYVGWHVQARNFRIIVTNSMILDFKGLNWFRVGFSDEL